jgi:hypothetical protein
VEPVGRLLATLGSTSVWGPAFHTQEGKSVVERSENADLLGTLDL